ncbi:MAG: molecular chaperone DnaJ [Candidatus Micrarchaeota archaeon]
MTKRDYYDILGVPRNASKDQIKRAYRELALKYHPDRSTEKGNEEKFKELSEAYAVLSDDTKKEQYDQFGHAGFDQRFSQEDIFRNADFSDFSDLFDQFGFGEDIFSHFFHTKRGRRRSSYYGGDLHTEIEITLEEAASGTTRNINLEKNALCAKCSGTGAEPNSGVKVCPKCKGTGQIAQTKRMGPMLFRSVSTCVNCRGEGSAIEKQCKNCYGRGSVRKNERILVHIPKGIHDGMQVRLDNEGEYGHDGCGDLYVHVHVAKHPIFERHKNDLYTEVKISLLQAILGAKIDVATIDGRNAKLEIPPGTQSHTLFKMHNEGMPDVHSGKKGDEFVRVIVQIPKNLSHVQKELIIKFDEEGKKKRFGIF